MNTSANDEQLQNPAFGWIMRGRWVALAIVVLLQILSFNGQWRVGRDSALYRGLGHSLAYGHGYVFPGEKKALVFPGLPFLLAAEERIERVGPELTPREIYQPRFELAVMFAIGVLTLLVVHRLISLHYPGWTAIWVTTALAVNWRFLQHENELMTDMPFLLGLCAALLGYAQAKIAKHGKAMIWPTILMTVGMALAMAMRPTVAALAGAWGIACTWEIIRNKCRTANVVSLGVLLVLCAAMVIARPATAANPGQKTSGFARKIYSVVQAIRESPGQEEADSAHDDSRHARLLKILVHHLPYAFFGAEMWYFSVPLSLLVITYGVWLGRQHLMWGLLVGLSIVMFILLVSQPRYYLMIMPLLLLGWARHVFYLQGLITRKWFLSRIYVVGALGLVVVPNFGKSVTVALEQHGLMLANKSNAALSRTNVLGLKLAQGSFLEVYRDGKMAAVCGIADQVRDHLPPKVAVIGPETRIMTFISGHPFYLLYEQRRDKTEKPQAIAKRLNIRWAVFPTNADPGAINKLYAEKEPHPRNPKDKNKETFCLTGGFLTLNINRDETPAWSFGGMVVQRFAIKGEIHYQRPAATPSTKP